VIPVKRSRSGDLSALQAENCQLVPNVTTVANAANAQQIPTDDPVHSLRYRGRHVHVGSEWPHAVPPAGARCDHRRFTDAARSMANYLGRGGGLVTRSTRC